MYTHLEERKKHGKSRAERSSPISKRNPKGKHLLHQAFWKLAKILGARKFLLLVAVVWLDHWRKGKCCLVKGKLNPSHRLG